MKLSLAHFFLLYVSVFTGLVLVAWLAFMRRRARLEKKGRRGFSCKTCHASFKEHVPYRRPRCPECGAIGDLVTLERMN